MKVLAFGAHPDDVELYAGGLVAALARSGVEVAIIDLTAGELGTRGTREIRAAEAAQAARILGASRECLQLPDAGLARTDGAQTRAVVEAFRRHAPALVLAPWEVDQHPDHREAAQLVRRARFLARVSRFDAGGPPCRPGPILFYEQKVPFEPHLVVDVGAVRDVKRRAVAAFASQFTRAPGDPLKTEISEPQFHEMLDARSRAHGARIGVTWGEGYRRDEPQAVLDAVQLLPGGAASGGPPA